MQAEPTITERHPRTVLLAFAMSALMFACLFLTGCGGGEPSPEDPEYVSEVKPDTPRPSNPCGNVEVCK